MQSVKHEPAFGLSQSRQAKLWGFGRRNGGGRLAAELIRNEPAATVFDVRDMASYQKAHVDGAAHLSEDRLLAWMRRLAKETPVVIYFREQGLLAEVPEKESEAA